MTTKQKTPYRLGATHSVLLVVGLVVVILQMAASGPLRDTMWGAHFYAFVPLPVGIVGWLMVLLCAVMLLRHGTHALDTPKIVAIAEKRTLVATLILALVCAVLFWVFRSQHLLLGDALPLKIDIARGQDFHPRQPLTMWLQQLFYEAAGPIFRTADVSDEAVARRTIALGSVIAGFFFVWVSVAVGRSIARQTKHSMFTSWLVAFVLISQGFMQLFFGYVENYTYYALFVGVFLWLSLSVLEGRMPLLMPGLALIAAVALHLSAAVLAPAFLVLVVWRCALASTRKAAIRDAAILVVVMLAVNVLGVVTREYNLLASLFDVSGQALGGHDERIANYTWSVRHLRDFFNEQLLIGPLGLLLFVPMAVLMVRGRAYREFGTVFLLVLGGSYLFVSWMAGDSNLGYARNWDLLAPGGICFAGAAVFFVLKRTRGQGVATRLLLFAVVVSFVQLAPWVWLNHNERLSLERVKVLPLGLGRSEVTVANWYLERGEREQARQWFKKALEVNPNNAPAYAFSAMLMTQDGRFDEAASLYERAVVLRPDKPEYRQNYALTLRELGRMDEAVPHLRMLTESTPDRVGYWRMLSQALMGLGREQEAIPANERLLRFADGRLRSNPRDVDALTESGILLVYLGREVEALERFEALLAIDAKSIAGLLNSGSVLVQLGRNEEARPFLQRFLALYPNHPNADWARDQLAQ